MLSCVVDGPLDPATTYEVELPYRLRADTAAPSTKGSAAHWLTVADFENYRKQIGVFRSTPGSGKMLQLKPAKAQRAVPESDVDPENNGQFLNVKVLGTQGTDVVAIGAKASGAAGDVVAVKIGLRNNGPATVDYSRIGGPASIAVLNVPPGTKLDSAPDSCWLVEDDSFGARPGDVQYACGTGMLLTAGETVTWKLALRIERVIPNATGTIQVNPACLCEIFSSDINKSNDKSTLVINPDPAGPASPTAAPDID